MAVRLRGDAGTGPPLMNRRGFLGRLAASFGALALAPRDVLWAPIPEAPAVVTPEAVTGLSQITVAMLNEIQQILGVSVPYQFDEPSKLGTTIRGRGHQTHTLNYQYSGTVTLPELIGQYGLDIERYLKPIAWQLAEQMRGVTAGGKLDLPRAAPADAYVVSDAETGLSLRATLAYDAGHDARLLRFDTLIAKSR